MQLRGSKLPRKGRCQPPHDVTPPPLRELKVGAERRSHYRAVTSPRLYRRWVVDLEMNGDEGILIDRSGDTLQLQYDKHSKKVIVL